MSHCVWHRIIASITTSPISRGNLTSLELASVVMVEYLDRM